MDFFFDVEQFNRSLLNNDISYIRQMIKNGFDVNTCIDDPADDSSPQKTILMFAILTNASHIVDFILSYPDLDLSITVPHDAGISNQMNALEVAALAQQTVFAEKILNVLREMSLNRIESKSIFKKMRNSLLIYCISSNLLSFIELILKDFNDPQIHFSILNKILITYIDNLTILDLVLKCGANPNFIVDVENEQLINSILNQNHGSIVHLIDCLIKSAAALDMQSNAQRTPLHNAVLRGRLDIAKVLIQYGAKIDHCDDNDHAPIHYAIIANHYELAAFFLENIPNIYFVNRKHQNLLHFAALSNNVAIANLLLKKAPALLNLSDLYGKTPLHVTIAYEHLSFFNFLVIEQGCNIEISSNDGNTPLLEAARFDQIEMIKILLTKGADIHKKNILGESIAHMAAYDSNKELFELIIEYHGNIEAQNNFFVSPIHIACSYGHLEIVELLIEANVALAPVDSHSNTPLHYAALNGPDSLDAHVIVQRLMEYNIPIDSLNHEGKSPLRLAIESKNLQTIDVLLTRNIKINSQDCNNLIEFEDNPEVPYQNIIDFINERFAEKQERAWVLYSKCVTGLGLSISEQYWMMEHPDYISNRFLKLFSIRPFPELNHKGYPINWPNMLLLRKIFDSILIQHEPLVELFMDNIEMNTMLSIYSELGAVPLEVYLSKSAEELHITPQHLEADEFEPSLFVKTKESAQKIVNIRESCNKPKKLICFVLNLFSQIIVDYTSLKATLDTALGDSGLSLHYLSSMHDSLNDLLKTSKKHQFGGECLLEIRSFLSCLKTHIDPDTIYPRILNIIRRSPVDIIDAHIKSGYYESCYGINFLYYIDQLKIEQTDDSLLLIIKEKVQLYLTNKNLIPTKTLMLSNTHNQPSSVLCENSEVRNREMLRS
ncbi:ankyrin repeat domain-containing protein [bacterium]|nr:ankyrin repeat domain-containing protein [bacterium]NBX72627.1 ankyrin repeat domain-containing protein [bacterium]